jgi:hypothetical protein
MSLPLTKEEAIKFFAAFYGGEHRFPGLVREWGSGFSICHSSPLSTFDGDQLTRLVVLAHQHLIRVEVSPASSNRVRIAIHKRELSGSVWMRHPSLDDLRLALTESGGIK